MEITNKRKSPARSAKREDMIVLPSGLAEQILGCCWSATSKLESQISRGDTPIGYGNIIKESFRVLSELQGVMRSQGRE